MTPAQGSSTELLFARAEIQDRLALYAHALDRRDWELFGEVFHDDAVWHLASWRNEMPGRCRPGL